MTLAPGSAAPQFELTDQHGQQVSLGDLTGVQHALLVFFPFAFSGICTGELGALRDELAWFTGADVQVVGLSCDPMFSLRAWAAAEGYAFPLLSDFWPHGEVARRYGVLDEQAGRPGRGTFLVDSAGRVRWSVVTAAGQPRSVAAYQEAVRALTG